MRKANGNNKYHILTTCDTARGMTTEKKTLPSFEPRLGPGLHIEKHLKKDNYLNGKKMINWSYVI